VVYDSAKRGEGELCSKLNHRLAFIQVKILQIMHIFICIQISVMFNLMKLGPFSWRNGYQNRVLPISTSKCS